MKFDTDRFAKLAGLPASDKAESAAPKSSASRSVMTEARRVARAQAPLLNESAEVQKLRAIIRREALSVIKEMREGALSRVQGKKSLNEAVTMGFYGPGFGGKSFILGGPMTSASRFASLKEVEEMDEAEVASASKSFENPQESDDLDESDDKKEMDEADDDEE